VDLPALPANLANTADPESRALPDNPDSLADPRQFASRRRCHPVSPAHLDLQDHPDLRDLQATPAPTDLPAPRVKTLRTAQPAPPAPTGHRDLQDLTAALVTRAKMAEKSRLCRVNQVNPENRDLTDLQVLPAHPDPTALPEVPGAKERRAHPAPTERTANPAKTDQPDHQVPLGRKAFAPSIVHSTVVFSSKTELAAKPTLPLAILLATLLRLLSRSRSHILSFDYF
jgi:hypothetical protein